MTTHRRHISSNYICYSAEIILLKRLAAEGFKLGLGTLETKFVPSEDIVSSIFATLLDTDDKLFCFPLDVAFLS